MNESKDFEFRFRLASMIVYAMLASVFIYFLVAYFFSQTREVTVGSMARYEELRRPLYGIAVVLSLGVIVFRRLSLSHARTNRVYVTRGATGVVQQMMMTTIIVAAMSEAVALLGLILTLLGRLLEDMWRLGIVGAVLLVYHFPRRSAWQRMIERSSYAT
jgi:hypothetical protein